MADYSVDFSPIAQLPQVYRQARQQANRERTLANLGQMGGDMDYNAAAKQLLAAGDMQGAMTLANLGNNQRNFQFQEKEAQRSQGNADRTYALSERQANATLEGGRIPVGWEKNPTGGLRPVAGGPEDPAYIKQKSDATDKGRQMSITDITKLTEEGQKYGDLTRFQDTFKPEFAGYTSTAIGNAANIAGRHLPEAVVGKTMAEGSAWWQGYDRYKNVVRHELYGSALTAPETAAFERADITPGMQPDQIKKNLSLQKSIVENGLKRKASAMISQGYRPDVIGKAYGVDLGGIGVPGQPQQQPQSPPQQAPQPAPQTGITRDKVMAARADQAGTLAEARALIQANPDKRDAIIKRLKQTGIDPAGL